MDPFVVAELNDVQAIAKAFPEIKGSELMAELKKITGPERVAFAKDCRYYLVTV